MSESDWEDFYKMMQEIEREAMYQPLPTIEQVEELLADLEDVEYDNAN